jgi:hypothetical protein
MENMLIYFMWITWTPLVTDLRVHITTNLLFLTILPPMYIVRKLQKLILRPILLFCSYIRQLIRRMWNTASVSTNFFRLRSSVSTFINITQWTAPQITSHIPHYNDVSATLTFPVSRRSNFLSIHITLRKTLYPLLLLPFTILISKILNLFSYHNNRSKIRQCHIIQFTFSSNNFKLIV